MTITNHLKRVKKHLHLVVAVVLTLAATSSAQATPLDLSLRFSPDIYSNLIDFTYTAATKNFLATGTARTYYPDDLSAGLDITGGIFTMNGVLDSSNKPTGTITINGLLSGTGSGLLLSGNLTDFGFGSSGGILEFLFNTTGGDLSGAIGPVGGLILGNTNFQDLDHDISPTRTASSDIGTPVPEPSTALLLLGGLGMFIAVRTRKNRSKA